MNDNTLRGLWDDPLHWTSGSYRCTDDPRLWVEKRSPGMGITLNFAHRWAWHSVALLFAATVPAPLALFVFGDVRAFAIAGGVSILAAVALFAISSLVRRDVARRGLAGVAPDKRD